MEKIIKILKEKKETISTMESCTGGLLANEITNINGSSEVFKSGIVAYSNEAKEYFGISKKIIKKYSVYSKEVAREMARVSSKIFDSDFSVGITGLLGSVDPNNKSNNINDVYICIYNAPNKQYNDYKIEAKGNTRMEKKQSIITFVTENLYKILKLC